MRPYCRLCPCCASVLALVSEIVLLLWDPGKSPGGRHPQVILAGSFVAVHYGTKLGHLETLKIHFPMSEGVSEVSERASGRESGPVLTSLFLFVPDHRAKMVGSNEQRTVKNSNEG